MKFHCNVFPVVLINDKSTLVQVMAWHRIGYSNGYSPLLLLHIYDIYILFDIHFCSFCIYLIFVFYFNTFFIWIILSKSLNFVCLQHPGQLFDLVSWWSVSSRACLTKPSPCNMRLIFEKLAFFCDRNLQMFFVDHKYSYSESKSSDVHGLCLPFQLPISRHWIL